MNKEEQWLLQDKYSGEKCEAFFTDLARLHSGEPLAYIIGSTPFLNCTIYLDSCPLVPRPETEFWTEEAIKSIRNCVRNCEHTNDNTYDCPVITEVRGPTPYLKVLDLCAGSGCVGIAVAKEIPEATIDFSEIDPSHIETIKKNVQKNIIVDYVKKYQILLSDLFENITKKYNFILTNPPYVDSKLDRTQSSVKNYEPHIALYGGMDGLEIIEKIIKQSRKYLTDNGMLYMEHEPEQVLSIQKIAKRYNFFCVTHNDQYNIPRYSVLYMAQ